jgi:hypothetical protein
LPCPEAEWPPHRTDLLAKSKMTPITDKRHLLFEESTGGVRGKKTREADALVASRGHSLAASCPEFFRQNGKDAVQVVSLPGGSHRVATCD